MAAPAPRLFGLLLPGPARGDRAACGGRCRDRRSAALAMAADVAVTVSLPSHPGRSFRGEEALDPGALRAAIAAYRRRALAEGDAAAGTVR